MSPSINSILDLSTKDCRQSYITIDSSVSYSSKSYLKHSTHFISSPIFSLLWLLLLLLLKSWFFNPLLSSLFIFFDLLKEIQLLSSVSSSPSGWVSFNSFPYFYFSPSFSISIMSKRNRTVLDLLELLDCFLLDLRDSEFLNLELLLPSKNLLIKMLWKYSIFPSPRKLYSLANI